MKKALPILIIMSATSILGACSGSDDPFSEGGGSRAGNISYGNYSFGVDPDNANPQTISVTYGDGISVPTNEIAAITGVKGAEELKFNVLAGDRNGIAASNKTINIKANYGIYDSTCVTNSLGSCTVTLYTNGVLPTLPGEDYNGFVVPAPALPALPVETIYLNIVSYTTGEESFTDLNGNGVFDEGDVFLLDQGEPFVDNNNNGDFDDGIDILIDQDGDGVYDGPDGLYTGSGCQHPTLCSGRSSMTIWESISLDLVTP